MRGRAAARRPGAEYGLDHSGKKGHKTLAGSRRGAGTAGQSIRKRPASLAYQSGY